MAKAKTNVVRSALSNILLLVNIILCIWAALCYAAAIVSPAHTRYLAIFSLTTPFVLLLQVAFFFFWLFLSAHKWRALLPLITIAAGYKVFLTIFGLHFFSVNNMAHSDGTIRIMSWNVHGMGVFDIHGGKDTADKIINIIKGEDADILCLTEFCTFRNDSLTPYVRRIMKNNGYTEYRFCYDNPLGKNIHSGRALFSRFPVDNYNIRSIGNERINVLTADLHLPGEKVMRMIALHLHSFGFSDHDKRYIEEVKSNHSAITERPEMFIWKFNYAYSIRAAEADTVAQIIKDSPYPVLLCGDFNDLPASYTYMTLKGNLKDAFIEKGSGLGRTYNAIIFSLRIDHILYDPRLLHTEGFECPSLYLSDHRPVIANFRVLEN
ncbi:MAG: endonuclease/exonuclease/phosphatase family protein [Taibaiella sp.]|nr:endonuclease/exonuclease/phosphatase family protein [Taibaiella sp.]